MQTTEATKPHSSEKELRQLLPVGKSANELIQRATEHPRRPIIQGLLNEGEILLLHGSEDSFKSFFVLQVAEAVSIGQPLLAWRVPNPRTVGVLETELNETGLGERLARMFTGGHAPENLRFFSEAQLREWRPRSLREKINYVQNWIDAETIQVLLIDTANDFFRGSVSPSQEQSVGEFFDELRRLRVQAQFIVRHDRKSNRDTGNPNDRIRGSAEWKEDPEVILAITREDRRTNEVVLSVDKLRYEGKPDPLTLWFDAETFRLARVPPLIAVLLSGKRSRTQIVHAFRNRFSIGQRKADEVIKENREFLISEQVGRDKYFDINLDKALETPWEDFVNTVG
jgi:hypothetical protein